jgi:hypothetical protein
MIETGRDKQPQKRPYRLCLLLKNMDETRLQQQEVLACSSASSNACSRRKPQTPCSQQLVTDDVHSWQPARSATELLKPNSVSRLQQQDVGFVSLQLLQVQLLQVQLTVSLLPSLFSSLRPILLQLLGPILQQMCPIPYQSLLSPNLPLQLGRLQLHRASPHRMHCCGPRWSCPRFHWHKCNSSCGKGLYTANVVYREVLS